MAEEPAAEIQLLRSQKAKLIEILSSDADFVLQHADSRCLLSLHGYQQVKACRIPSEKVTDLLDHIIQRGPEAARGLLELLKDQALQETFPLLHFIKDLQVSMLSSETRRKRRGAAELQETIPAKQICNNSSRLVTEKQLMMVARAIGRCWREIGRLALDIPAVKLEQIEEDHSVHMERVFAMLRYWSICRREKATAALLHSLLSQGDWSLSAESIDLLLETD
uniref:Zgc:174906 n=1 Tax=Seriola lalandi dorsalis TaxID=1841481 RepID=A0A3B4WKM7_SERLL